MRTTDAREGTASETRTVASIIGGHAPDGAPGGRLTSTNPARTSETVAEVSLGDAGIFVEACRAAREAQREWASVPAPIRSQVVKKIGRVVEKNKEALARLVTREIGKPYAESLGEVQEIIDTCDFFTGEGRRLYGQTVPSEMPDKQLFTFRVPVGVAAIITAGNFPVAVPSWYLIPALTCGNAVVWKPAEYSPAIGDALARLFMAGGLRRVGEGPRRKARRQGRLYRLFRGREEDRRALRQAHAVSLPGARRQEPPRSHARRRPRPCRRRRPVLGLRHGGTALHLIGHRDRPPVRPRRVCVQVHSGRRGVAHRRPDAGRAVRTYAQRALPREVPGVVGSDSGASLSPRLERDGQDICRQPARGLRRRARGRHLRPPDNRRRRYDGG